jgi:tRNA 2-thiouridine synthesizing protein E
MATKQKTPKTERRRTVSKVKVKSTSKAKPTNIKSAGSTKSTGKQGAPAATAFRRKPATGGGGPSAVHGQASSNPRTIFELLHPGAATGADPDFRDAPDGWTAERARVLAAAAGLGLTDDHWEVIRVLQGCYKDELQPRIRLLRDALEARFANKGGMKYLFGILPGGPIAQGCALAGVKPPHGATDLSFGSVA